MSPSSSNSSSLVLILRRCLIIRNYALPNFLPTVKLKWRSRRLRNVNFTVTIKFNFEPNWNLLLILGLIRHTDTNHSKMFINSPLLISQVFPAILRKSREIRSLLTFYNVTSINFTKKNHISIFRVILTLEIVFIRIYEKIFRTCARVYGKVRSLSVDLDQFRSFLVNFYQF